MSKKMKMICVLLIVSMSIFSACGKNEQSASGKSSQKDKLIIGTDGGYYPYCFINDDGDLDGFEVELWEEIDKRIDEEVEIKTVAWNGIFGMLDTGKIDTIACQMTINEERKEKYGFTSPYMYTNQILAVKKGNEDTIKTKEDMAGKKIGVCSGGNTYNSLVEYQKNIDFELAPYDESTGLFYDIDFGRIDAGYINELTVSGAIEKGEFELGFANCEPLYFETNAYPYIKSEDNEEVWKNVDEAIKKMHEDGALKELSMKWFKVDATQSNR